MRVCVVISTDQNILISCEWIWMKLLDSLGMAQAQGAVD